jgi:methyl-accepting chemotaxis protein
LDFQNDPLPNRLTDRISLVVSLGGILLLGGLGILISRSVGRALYESIFGLIEGSDQVAAASRQVSTSSRQLAEGASQQAASIEETSASLEEISTVTKQNAENSSQANRLVEEAKEVAGKANQSMVRLTQSMGEISKANLETQKIIKTIDEIAFQTNLLALNAAVEAARAGESGAGFAVVADEVRNLAMRAAEAAKNTANLIEGTVKTVKEGSALVETTSREFNSVAAAVSKSGVLIGEIASASGEQSRGIVEVSEAVVELDSIVQSTAAGAEESSAAADQMNTQAEQMKVFVSRLESLVHGSKSSRKRQSGGAAAKPANTARGNPIHPSASASAKNKVGPPSQREDGKDSRLADTIEKRPEKVIPFDDRDLTDF